MVGPREKSGVNSPRRPPAKSPEARELELIGLTYDLAEKQIREGSASSQVMTHFLKAGATRDKVEIERIRADARLKEAQIINQTSAENNEKLAAEAIAAFRGYSGQELPSDDDY